MADGFCLRGCIVADPLEAEKEFIARQPISRLATVEDMTPVVICLPSDESHCVAGQAISVDCGMTI